MVLLTRCVLTLGEKWIGVDMASESIADNFLNFVWEPALVKTNYLSAATEAACLILSVDETIKNKEASEDQFNCIF